METSEKKLFVCLFSVLFSLFFFIQASNQSCFSRFTSNSTDNVKLKRIVRFIAQKHH